MKFAISLLGAKIEIVSKLFLYFPAIIFFIFFFNTGEAQTNISVLGEVVSKDDTCQKIDKYLTTLSKEKSLSGGLLIIKDGKKIFSKGYGFADKDKNIAFTSSTLVSMGSITKLFTATAIMKLYEHGKLSLTDNLKKYFPFITKDKEDITIHQLLTHSSGINDFAVDERGDYQKINATEFLTKTFHQPLFSAPGTKGVYTNVGMSILAMIVEKASGMDYEQFLRKELFLPLGIKHIGYQYPQEDSVVIAHAYKNETDWGTDQTYYKKAGGGPFWNMKGSSGLEASLEEMCLWENSFTNATLLHDSTIRKMFTPYIVEKESKGLSFFGYGCDIETSRRKTKVIDNGGGNGIYFARLVRYEDEGLVFYLVTNESSVPAEKLLPNVTQLYFNGKFLEDSFLKEEKKK